jgi:hypothetical protein
MKQLLFLIFLFVTNAFIGNAQVVTSPSKRPAVRSVPDSVVQKMQEDKDYAYANDMSYWKKAPPRRRNSFDKLLTALTQSMMVKVILYAMLIAGILYAIYQVMVVNNFFIFSGGRRKKKGGEESDNELSSENLDVKINEAVAGKNYRHAIRFMYLKTLKLLSDNNIITLHAKSTNQDYVRQMYKHDNLAQFRNLTRIYEYVWYGEFNPSEAQFDIISTNFNQFNRGR